MKRQDDLLKKRETFVVNYIKESKGKLMKTIILELVERLFLSERTIYNIWAGYKRNNKKQHDKTKELDYNIMIMSYCRSLFKGPIDENHFLTSECGDYDIEVTWNPHRELQYYELIHNDSFILWFNYSNETNTFDEKIPNTPKGSEPIKELYEQIIKLKFI